jgi:hypothetical protein
LPILAASGVNGWISNHEDLPAFLKRVRLPTANWLSKTALYIAENGFIFEFEKKRMNVLDLLYTTG